jgi:photosystem II stability/assembly factor-like uncharacterized protein
MRCGCSIISVVLFLAAAAAAAPDWPPSWKPIPQSSNAQPPPEKGEWTNMTPVLFGLAAVPNSDVMIAVGQNGIVLRSEDRGLRWKQIDEAPTNLNIYSVVAVPNRDVLIAVGDRGAVLRSDDKGAHWNRIENGSTDALYAVVALENTDLLVSVGVNGAVVRSEDGGAHWKRAEGTTAIGASLFAIAEVKNTNLVIAVGAGGVVLRSDDKGAHWSRVDGVPTRRTLRAIATIADTNVLVAVGDGGTILRSDDYGAHWKQAEGTTTDYFFIAVAEVKKADMLIAVGARGAILRSEDKGAHWNRIERITTDLPLRGVHSVANGDLLVAIGQGGTVLRSEDGGMHWQQVQGGSSELTLFAVGAAANADLLVATGQNGTVLRSEDGGAHWGRVRGAYDRGLLSLTAGASSELLVAVGGGSEILRSEDKGAHWMRVENVPASQTLYSVTAVRDTGLLVAVGDGGVVLRSEDKGAHWMRVEDVPTIRSLYSVVAVWNTPSLVAVGDEGVVLRSDDRGAHWHRVEAVPADQDLKAVVAIPDTGLLIAVGAEGVVLRSEDKGARWTRVEGVPTSQTLWAVAAAPNANSVVAVGDLGVAVRSSDAGRTWFRDITRTNASMRGVVWTNGGDGRPDLIAVGAANQIEQLRRNNVRTPAAASEFDVPLGEGFGIAWRYPVGRRVNCSGMDYRIDGVATWNRIQVNPVGSFEGDRQTYRLLWHPTFLAPGTRIHYAFDCTDLELYLTWRQELPAALAQTWNPPGPIWNTLWENGLRHPAWFIAAMAITGWSSILMLLYVFAPQRLLALHELLPEGETPNDAAGLVERIFAGTGGLLLWAAKSLLLLSSLSPRATNAWVVERADKAFEYFTRRTNTVSDRANVIDLPVTVNSEEVSSTHDALHRLMQQLPMALLITGPGGSGKTTLACQIDRFALLQKSRLLEALSENENLVRIAPDPIAEHLVARFFVKTLGVAEQGWHTFLHQLDVANRPADFIQALLACFDHPDYGRDIPSEIRQELRGLTPD